MQAHREDGVNLVTKRVCERSGKGVETLAEQPVHGLATMDPTRSKSRCTEDSIHHNNGMTSQNDDGQYLRRQFSDIPSTVESSPTSLERFAQATVES
jgi:hypothetical protein